VEGWRRGRAPAPVGGLSHGPAPVLFGTRGKGVEGRRLTRQPWAVAKLERNGGGGVQDLGKTITYV
jgi:hypothetical protein